jgi:hypothetical protein
MSVAAWGFRDYSSPGNRLEDCLRGRYNGLSGGSSSVAERQLPKLNVAGSIPVSRSIAEN